MVLYCTAISNGFEHSSYNFTEPLSNSVFEVFLAKENGRTSEQTFKVVIQVFDSGFHLNESSKLATLLNDFHIADAEFQNVSTVTLDFPSSLQRIIFNFILLQDNVTESTEVFIASSAPAELTTAPNGEILHIPTYLSPTNLSAETFIYIEDCKFMFHIHNCMLAFWKY